MGETGSNRCGGACVVAFGEHFLRLFGVGEDCCQVGSESTGWIGAGIAREGCQTVIHAVKQGRFRLAHLARDSAVHEDVAASAAGATTAATANSTRKRWQTVSPLAFVIAARVGCYVGIGSAEEGIVGLRGNRSGWRACLRAGWSGCAPAATSSRCNCRARCSGRPASSTSCSTAASATGSNLRSARCASSAPSTAASGNRAAATRKV